MDDPMIGRQIGSRRLARRLSYGPASVFLARDERLARDVVVKLMSPFQYGDETYPARFVREAQITAKLSHPNIVHIYDFGQQDDLMYMVMEYLPGGSLLDLIHGEARRGRRVEQARALDVVSQVALALEYAHRHGVIHRDVKPSNILFAADGRPVLTDLGIAKASEGPRLTKTLLTVGTPEYMSPEQGRGDRIDARTDIYSLGVVLYELLAGTIPFQADTPWGIIHKHIYEPLPAIQERNPGVSLAIRSVVEKALAKRPEDRIQDGREMADAIQRAREHPNRRIYAPVPFRVTPQPGAVAPAAAARSQDQTVLMEGAGQASPAPAPRPRGRSRGWLWGGILAMLLALTVGAVLLSRSGWPGLRTLSGVVETTESAVPANLGDVTPESSPAPAFPTVTLAVAASTPRLQPTASPLAPVSTRTPTPMEVAPTRPPSPTPAASDPTSTRVRSTSTRVLPTVTAVSAAAATQRRPVASPTPPRPVRTATRQPLPTKPPTGWPAPGLLLPPDRASPSGRTTFSWTWNGPELEPGQAFEVRIWKDGQPFHYGAAVPVRTTSEEIDVGASPGVTRGGSGEYLWTVAVVQVQPYAQVGPEATPRVLIVSGEGGGGAGAGKPTAPSP